MIPQKIIIAPDSFKGTLTAEKATDIIADEIRKAFPDCEIVKMPIADGGEGSVEAVLSAIGGETVDTDVLSPDNRTISARFGIANNGTAIIEMAQSSGITRQIGLNPMTSNTFGFGQLILAACQEGQSMRGDGSPDTLSCQENRPHAWIVPPDTPDTRNFTLCIGGSATTDGGCGMAAALGVKFFDQQGISFIPCGETLSSITNIDLSGIDNRIAESRFTVMCDVDNPLHGKNGAAYIYGPQKGATPEQVAILDNGLRHYGTVLTKTFGKSFDEIPGAGAAGGLGAGCMAYLGASLKSGIDAILELYSFKNRLQGTDLIITGEGKLDSQSFQGKVLSGILRDAGTIPIIAICGVCDYDPALLKEKGIAVFEASEGTTIEDSMKEPEKFLRIAAKKAIQGLNDKKKGGQIHENH